MKCWIPGTAAVALLSGLFLAGCATQRVNRIEATSSASAACPECAEDATGEATPVRKPGPRPAPTPHTPTPAGPFVTDWLEAAARKVRLPDLALENQDGRVVHFADYRGAPVAMSFIYTRCQNQRKCPLVARMMAQLAEAVLKAGITPQPRIVLVTYDPEYDTPAELAGFGARHGLPRNDHVLLLRPGGDTKNRLFERLKVGVNYNAAGVNLHNLQLLLFDKQGRCARAYHSLIWDNAEVLRDLAILAAE